jgi:hypothetical protein
MTLAESLSNSNGAWNCRKYNENHIFLIDYKKQPELKFILTYIKQILKDEQETSQEIIIDHENCSIFGKVAEHDPSFFIHAYPSGRDFTVLFAGQMVMDVEYKDYTSNLTYSLFFQRQK